MRTRSFFMISWVCLLHYYGNITLAKLYMLYNYYYYYYYRKSLLLNFCCVCNEHNSITKVGHATVSRLRLDAESCVTKLHSQLIAYDITPTPSSVSKHGELSVGVPFESPTYSNGKLPHKRAFKSVQAKRASSRYALCVRCRSIT